MGDLKKKMLKGSLWSLTSQLGYLIIILLTNIIFTRILPPSEFGKIGVVMFFILVSGVFVEGGLGAALVRKEKIKKIDYSTVFTFNLILGVFFFFIICFIRKNSGLL
ncbi:oligosaccharide flippase family protein [Tenacibaculum tangerinum]|uniref:Oligosaccharide flippase family protein n=1 Tax=Tenacibaculum tangerinum TaxID=3038772 RepID=A0ABY8LAD7_9FLAO|nr:oligosaccharide flippase family protein [Tenacibaculum tangerinum]WGH76985.1 oligosaccharide flippase family protein [Tenacibaculum tangerinum]